VKNLKKTFTNLAIHDIINIVSEKQKLFKTMKNEKLKKNVYKLHET
jgi:hypothetical protein